MISSLTKHGSGTSRISVEFLESLSSLSLNIGNEVLFRSLLSHAQGLKMLETLASEKTSAQVHKLQEYNKLLDFLTRTLPGDEFLIKNDKNITLTKSEKFDRLISLLNQSDSFTNVLKYVNEFDNDVLVKDGAPWDGKPTVRKHSDEKKIVRRSNLQAEEKPFICKRCELRYTLKANLNAHLRIKHESSGSSEKRSYNEAFLSDDA